jgi:hypothetical protein
MVSYNVLPVLTLVASLPTGGGKRKPNANQNRPQVR